MLIGLIRKINTFTIFQFNNWSGTITQLVEFMALLMESLAISQPFDN